MTRFPLVPCSWSVSAIKRASTRRRCDAPAAWSRGARQNPRRSRPGCSTQLLPTSTAARRHKHLPKASPSAAISFFVTSATPNRRSSRRYESSGVANAKVRAGLARGIRIAEAVAWARDLINEPAAAKSPADVAELARKIGRACGLKVKVMGNEELVRERMGGVLGVGEGSERPPRFLRLEHAPPNARGRSRSSVRASCSTRAGSR